MSNIIREIGYTGFLQRLFLPEGFSADVTVHAWGGGGGGGGFGGDGNGAGGGVGGSGGGGGYIAKTLTVGPNDVLEIAVGGGGSGAETARPIAYTGSTASNPWGTGIVAGTSGYYVRNVGVSGGSNYIIGYAVVVDGVIIYQADTPTAGNNVAPPPADQIVKTTLVGSSYFVTIPQPNNNTWGLPTDQDLYELVECFSFILYNGGGAVGQGGEGGESLKLPTYQYIVGGSSPLVFDILTIGGGGGGGGGSSRAFFWSGAGGGAGDIRYSSVIFNPGDRIGIDVGRGGAAGLVRDGFFTPGAPGTAGTASQVRRDASLVVKANGGGGGQQAQNSRPVPGSGGSGSGNFTQPLRPQAGTSQSNGTSGIGGNGGTGGNGYLVPPDAVGPYAYGSTGAGGIGNTNIPGQTGTVYGGGGGGGGQNAANNSAGFFPATGGSGAVIISYTTTNGVPVLAGGDITIRGLRVTHIFSVGTESAYNGGNGGVSVTGEGAGGGGGGATVILFNGAIVGYAGGGGGGGGGGNLNPEQGQGQNAPGPNGQSIAATAGSNGESSGVGGGGGGGAGGNGGAGDPQGSGAQAGAFGRLIGDVTATPSGTQPGGINTPYYPVTVSVGVGGMGQTSATNAGLAGTSGYAVVVMQTKSFQIKDSGTWKPVNHAFIKYNNAWQEIQAIWIKQNDLWYPVIGGGSQYNPYFGARLGYFGSIPRPYGT